ncbi:hypothetical protein JOE59_000159 [Agromyces cerinus]|uniref:hypothetical protein n=1 Tax=Agromyces cerinus TaxID=33878 RepID=UPI001956B331|nr:hypothetical protein [Agromyces cerinus]MBM7829454.1 hypothetical protein [Agromyces cerinus]
MARRREIPTPHREFFRAVTIDETVALSCTCRRGVDHWYGEPLNEASAQSGPDRGRRGGATRSAPSDEQKLSLRALRRAPGAARLAS